MANWNAAGYALTAAGRRLQAKVEAGLPLNLTRMKFGSGNETSADVDALIDLVAPEVSIGISSAEVTGEDCIITGNLLVNNVAHGFWCREWGVFAQDPDEGEILYLIALDDQPDWIPAGAEIGTSITYAMRVKVANATTVMAQIDVTGLVDVDMLLQHTHTARRLSKYDVSDVLNAPTLQDGLLLECQSGGTTAETLVDYSDIQWGEEFLDGSVAWRAKRIMLAPNDIYCYNPEWMALAIQRLILFAQSVQRNAAQIVSPDGTVKWLGGAGRDVDVDHIIPGPGTGGTFFIELSYSEPQSMEYAWLQTDSDIGTTYNARPVFKCENGDTIGATKIQIVREDGVVFWLDTISREPRSDGGSCPCPEMATDAEVMQMLDETLPL